MFNVSRSNIKPGSAPDPNFVLLKILYLFYIETCISYTYIEIQKNLVSVIVQFDRSKFSFGALILKNRATYGR